LAQKYGVEFIECSAKTGANIDDTFLTITEVILEKVEKG